MALLKFVHSSPINSRLVFSDTKKPPKNKKLVKRVELPPGTCLEDFARQHWPSRKEIPKGGYVIIVHEAYEMRYVNGTKERIKVPMLYYIAAKR